MRVLARIGYTLAGLALIAPAATQAGMPIPAPGPYTAGMPKAKAPAKAKRFCANCQRQKLMAETGANIPAPPPLPAGVPVPGEVCSRCSAPTAVVTSNSAPIATCSGPGMVVDHSPPGRAVVGGTTGEAGYASVGGPSEPAPVGVVSARYAANGYQGAAGSRDASVMPTSAGRDPVSPNTHSNPRVLSHLFGLSGIGRERALIRERRKEETHARIPYGQQAQQVNDVPASLIYGR